MTANQVHSNGATRVGYILGVPLADRVVRQWPQMGEIVRTKSRTRHAARLAADSARPVARPVPPVRLRVPAARRSDPAKHPRANSV